MERVLSNVTAIRRWGGTGESMYRISHNQMKHLADEFMENPIGQHSADLRRLLMVFRGEPAEGKFVLVCTKPYKEWTLAHWPQKKGQPVKMTNDKFSSVEDAEREVFRRRWKKYTGHELNL